MIALTVVVAALAGAIGVPAINKLKALLGWSGEKVKFLAAGVSAVLTFAALGLACVVAIVGLACVLPLTWATAAGAIGVAYTVGQLIYALLPKS